MPIKELPEKIAVKIAAGEVVERPVSVVKELVENAIDAGAEQISIRINQAGKELIEVIDNGSGIPSSEVRIAVKRYATSKISELEDLERIKTWGFRGEALASIASVSQFHLATRSGEEDTGVELLMENQKEVRYEIAALPEGTRISVQHLFFNVPARLKFLKSDITERRLISELVSQYALIYPHIRFQLSMEGKLVFQSSGNGKRREIISRIYDLETSKKLLEANYEQQNIQVCGYISPLGITRSNRKEIRFSINGRRINNQMLSSAVLRAYHGYLMVGRYPIVTLFIQLPETDIDVNVHPAKAEIKFKDESGMFSIIHSAIRKTISAYFPIPSIPENIWNTSILSGKETEEANQQQIFNSTFEDQKTPETNLDHLEETPLQITRTQVLRLIGQLGLTYIAAEGPDGLYLIDQHAAHERILFEKMMNPDEDKASQLLLQAATINIPFELDEVLETRLPALNKLGFGIEPFGLRTYKITALPAAISKMDPETALRSSIEPDEDDREFLDNRMKELIISKICKKAAVKGGQVLSKQEQEQLIRELEKCESPRTCPHGRPTMIYLSVNTLQRQFGRKGSV